MFLLRESKRYFWKLQIELSFPFFFLAANVVLFLFRFHPQQSFINFFCPHPLSFLPLLSSSSLSRSSSSSFSPECIPQAFSIVLSQVIANDRTHRQRQDSYRQDPPQREEHKDSSDLVSSILQVYQFERIRFLKGQFF